jgi:hypothetical protein
MVGIILLLSFVDINAEETFAFKGLRPSVKVEESVSKERKENWIFNYKKERGRFYTKNPTLQVGRKSNSRLVSTRSMHLHLPTSMPLEEVSGSQLSSSLSICPQS